METVPIKEFLHKFAELYEKQDVLSRLNASEFLKEYSYSEIHCIRSIGKIEKPNVTKISNDLKMTKGAISKITKKLLTKDAIKSYTSENNKKEIYFKLTKSGEMIFKEHLQNYEEWIERDSEFFKNCSPENLNKVNELLDMFNEFLKSKIEELSNNSQL